MPATKKRGRPRTRDDNTTQRTQSRGRGRPRKITGDAEEQAMQRDDDIRETKQSQQQIEVAKSSAARYEAGTWIAKIF